ncbi:MAG: polysaccharide deacetylase family protein [Anaerolineales bacterium]|jgi:hypothetical protein
MFSSSSRIRNWTARRCWRRSRRTVLLLAASFALISCALTASQLPAETQAFTPADPPARENPPKPGSSVPPLYFFYVIHTHSSSEHLPFTDPSQTVVDPDAAAGLERIIRSLQETLDRNGIKASWHVTTSMAKGYCTAGQDDSIFHRLQQAGHEIGAHAHNRDQIHPAYLALTQECGITPKVISGLLVEASKVPGPLAQEIFSDAFDQSVALGMTLTTENLAPSGGKNPLADVCTAFGDGNDMWETTGNLMFPWRPDFAAGNVCIHNPDSPMLLVNHVSIEVFLEGGTKPDVLGADSFAALRTYLDGALAYMAAARPARPAVWGFVTHIIEYAHGDGTSGPDADSIAALDSFLAYVDALREQGSLTVATISRIAEAVDGAR